MRAYSFYHISLLVLSHSKLNEFPDIPRYVTVKQKTNGSGYAAQGSNPCFCIDRKMSNVVWLQESRVLKEVLNWEYGTHTLVCIREPGESFIDSPSFAAKGGMMLWCSWLNSLCVAFESFRNCLSIAHGIRKMEIMWRPNKGIPPAPLISQDRLAYTACAPSIVTTRLDQDPVLVGKSLAHYRSI